MESRVRSDHRDHAADRFRLQRAAPEALELIQRPPVAHQRQLRPVGKVREIARGNVEDLVERPVATTLAEPRQHQTIDDTLVEPVASEPHTGVRGLRLNILYGGGIGFEKIERFDALACEMGWHLQLLLDARNLVELAPRIAKLRCPWVVDHMGHMPYAAGADHPGFKALVQLVTEGGWVKLSSASRMSELPDYRDSTPFAQALVAAAPERCLWGSDWPHVAQWKPMPTVSGLLDLFAEWVPDAALRDRILVDNAHRFYGFERA